MSVRRSTPIRQASLRRLKEFGLRPIRDLGQNFLIDDNLLAVIGRESELGDDDVVLEVGGGLGVLTEYLVARAAFVHVYEIDSRLRPALEDAIGSSQNIALHIEDAAKAELQSLTPAANKIISNLPYAVATPVIIRTIYGLPEIKLWCLMVQREIAERLSAGPGGKEYAASSVLTQLVCSVELVRSVSRTVFVPRPNVDSALVRLRRVRPLPCDRVTALVRAAFAHRRKALPASVALAIESGQLARGVFGMPSKEMRRACATGLGAIGEPEDARAERLRPVQFVQLVQEVAPCR